MLEDYLIEEKKYKGRIIKLYIDYNSESPRNWDNLGKIISLHSRYDFTDDRVLYQPEPNQEAIQELFKEEDAVIFLPIYFYAHGGLTLSTKRSGMFCDRWDSGMLGYIYATRDDIQKEFHCKNITTKIKGLVTKLLEDEIETLDAYLTGQVYGFVIEQNGEVVDSCWGCYDYDDMVDEINQLIDCWYKNEYHQLRLWEDINDEIRHDEVLAVLKTCTD